MGAPRYGFVSGLECKQQRASASEWGIKRRKFLPDRRRLCDQQLVSQSFVLFAQSFAGLEHNMFSLILFCLSFGLFFNVVAALGDTDTYD